MPKKVPIGKTNFKQIIEQGYYFVDKSLLIKEVVDAAAEVLLIPRPRRFGKTLNMQMLYYFFRKSEEDDAELFRDLAVAQLPEVMAHQGQYPVVYFNLKGIRGATWPAARELLEQLISNFCRAHSHIADGMDHVDRRDFDSLVRREASEATLRNSLENLAVWLRQYYERPVIILLDEYDTPILQAYSNGYYGDMISFMQSWLGGGLKLETHPDVLHKAVVTGIMRVAKESLFSGLNNPKVYPLQRMSPFEDKFGFTEGEIQQLLTHYGLTHKLDEVNEWYNGYQFGNTTIYNPWSIIHYIDDQPNPPGFYWVNSSSNDLVYEILGDPTDQLRDDVETLLSGGSIVQDITDAAVLRNGVRTNDVWSYLLAAGYLKACLTQDALAEPTYAISLPNRELREVLKEVVNRWIAPGLPASANRGLLNALLRREWHAFEANLNRLTLNMLSYYTTAADKPGEVVIQVFVLGLLSWLNQLYGIRAEREEGQGRADIVMNPFDKSQPGFVIEFKAIGPDDDLDHALDDALAQIEQKQYSAGLEADGVKDIARLAIALQGKTVTVRVGLAGTR